MQHHQGHEFEDGMGVERGKKSSVLDVTISRHDQQRYIILKETKGNSVIEIDRTQVMAFLLFFLCCIPNVKLFLDLDRACNTSMAEENEVDAVLDDLGRLHVVGNVGRLKFEELPVLF